MYQLEWKDKQRWFRRPRQGKVVACPDEKQVKAASALIWEEHCVECSAPACFTSCQLYENRGDGNCRRFSYGIYPNRGFSGLLGYGADIRFKRWGKLEAVWPETPTLFPINQIRCLDFILGWFDWLSQCFAKILPVKFKLGRRMLNGLRFVRQGALKLFGRWAGMATTPDALYIKFYSPEPKSFNLQLELIQDVPVFRNNLKVVPGWNEHVIPFGKLNFLSGTFRYLRVWVDKDEEVSLVFTWLDLVKFASGIAVPQKSASADKVKCVVWDLDNTLWKGVIGDDGKAGVQAVPEALKLIQRLDQRGIIQTVVSKNEYATAWEKLVELKLDQFFLYPAINWNPKSVNIALIAKELNVNVNSFALLDDSVFEREEVLAAYPQVRVYDPAVMASLLDYEEFDVPVTKEAGLRRIKYLEDINRKSVEKSWNGSLDEFLKECSIELKVRCVHLQEQIDRCLELLQRSNQFNLSGKRYSADEFLAHLRNPDFDSYVLEVQDRYGDYGIVGFVSVQKKSDAVIATDFVMSCRVARKKIENAFFYWYLSRQECVGKKAYACMKVTGKNMPLRQVFAELKFVVVAETDSELMLQLDVENSGLQSPPILIQALETGGALPLVSLGNVAPAASRFEYPLHLSLVWAKDLTAEQVQRWSAIQASVVELESPFYRPEFTQACAQIRGNVFVGLLQEPSGKVVGFFPFQLLRPGFGKPLDICDYQGVIASPSLAYSFPDLMRACGLKSWEFDHLNVNQTAFQPYQCQAAESPLLDLSLGYEAYTESLSPEGKRHLAKARTSARKAQRELGPLRFVYHTTDDQVMQTMHQWRAQKYGPLPESAHQTLEILRSMSAADFSGVLSALYAGEKLLAVHFGIRSRSVLHWWFPAYNPELASYAPGILLLLAMAERGAELGIAKIDLGKGIQDYKRRFQNGANTVVSGSVDLFSLETAPRIILKAGRTFIRNTPSVRKLIAAARRVAK